MTSSAYDVVIIGGGINGCGCAADAALRGLSVLLCEKDDLASKTSSSSSKLIHGGLRYLEHLEFNMVKKSLDERQRLFTLAPHLIRPLTFVLPHHRKQRPLWVLRAGLFLYDNLSRTNQLPKSRCIQRKKDIAFFTPLNDALQKGFIYADATTDDARLTIANALQARAHGASILTRTTLIAAKPMNNQWELTLQTTGKPPYRVTAKTVINATGPWVKPINQLFDIPCHYPISLVKGSHLVVKALYEGPQGYVLQHDDKRIVFVVPYHGYTMIGTTDIALEPPLDAVEIDSTETAYLLALVNQYFKKQLTENDIISSWSGVRTLLAAKGKSAKALSRDIAYHYSKHPAPITTIYSGKITTYRQLAAEAINTLRDVFPNLPASKTAHTPLVGLPTATYNEETAARYPWLEPSILQRYIESYGTATDTILVDCKKPADLGMHFGHQLYEAEVDYLIRHEWALTMDDILWRRTKLGLRFSDDDKKKLCDYLL